jgi:hypothetical protein
MTKHYILNLKPQADRDWDKCSLRNPITGEHADLTKEIAQAVGNQSGSYLIAVQIEVTVLEKAENSTAINQEMQSSSSNKTITTIISPQPIAS